MGLGLARPSPNRPGPIYQLGPRLAQAQRWPKGRWPKLALGQDFLAQAQPKKIVGHTSDPKRPKRGPNDTIQSKFLYFKLLKLSKWNHFNLTYFNY